MDQIYASTSLSQLEELGFTDGPTISPELVLAQDKSYTILVEAYHEKKVTHPELNDLVDRVYKTKTIAELKGIMVPFTSEETDTETPSEPDKPTEPETPGESDTPTEPETPGESDTPTEPETPGESDTPTEPETPGKSDTPTETETPGKSDTPTETETPGESDTPTEPETPGESDKPTKRKTPGESDTPTETRTSADSRKSSKEKIESNQETTALPQTNEVKNSSWLVGGLSTLVASFSLFRRNN
ncbi:LPXTG cell wall anchor domain-containing protein [Vagococcus salmoninarum]|uniref:LPXTG cell wall anchor domain-containing protein n=1 Tax=Vagococcus salmoninarum TaxID=2739 RepID=UPI00398AA241